MNSKRNKWRFAVDRGGTFTDIVAVDPDDKFYSLKLLSNSPEYSNASIQGIKRLLKNSNVQKFDSDVIESIRFGTTVATNALLERRGGKITLIITKGFSDLLEIGNQTRPEIFNLRIEKPSNLYSSVYEINERIDSQGNIVKTICHNNLKDLIKIIKSNDYDAVAVVLLHSWKNPEHELIIEKELLHAGIKTIFLSHKTINLIKVVTRGQSTVMDAYLSPIIASYLEGIKNETAGIDIEFIQSSGALSSPIDFKGKDALLSGPAGGAIAAGSIATDYNLKGAIGLDMGGTSTDVSRFDGKFEKIYEQVIAGVELQKESLNINTIAAGGGSILWFDDQKMKVGPKSAGSYPGPACYGFGGPLTITDANLITGRLAPDFLPETFGKNRNSSIDIDIVKNKFNLLTNQINNSTAQNISCQTIALGYLRIANEKMATAIKEISVSKGFDVREYALICFGGAAGQHACQIANMLDINKVIFHPLSGVMSAYGIGLASPIKTKAITLLKPYTKKLYMNLMSYYNPMFKDLTGDNLPDNTKYKVIFEYDLRPVGTDSFITIEYNDFESDKQTFKEKYIQLYGFEIDNMQLEIVNIRLSVQESGEYFLKYNNLSHNTKNVMPYSYQEIFYHGGSIKVPVYKRDSLYSGLIITGPAVIVDQYSTLIVDPEFEANIKEDYIIELIALKQSPNSLNVLTDKPDPILLEVFNNQFMSIATEMGHTLRNTAHSVNIKERLDFSCAIFDANGDLVANAPHIPVHLGSMTDTVKSVINEHKNTLKSGDIYISNNPYKGGSHLPDVTVICPVFSEGNKLLFFTATRGHHADIGGEIPGSLPPVALHINEEGVLIDNFLAVRDGQLKEKELINILCNHKYPVRNIKERIYDLKAQIASCYKGANELNKLIERYTHPVVDAYMKFIQNNAEYCVKQALAQFLNNNNTYSAEFKDYMDDGTQICVNITIKPGSNPPDTIKAFIDFTGTAPQHTKDNLNTPLSVTRSAILYVLRSITDIDIPLNSGCIKPIEIIVPEGSLLNPLFPAPVATGNVETSQRIVDVLLGALGITSASQGTMNNLLFEVEDDTPYYETIAGGAGALDGYHGASAVQVHMTNTRITDPEILEYRHPDVLLEQFNIRKNSGGCL